MTVGQALRACPIDAREARLLLAEASGCSEATVVAFPERELSAQGERRFHGFVERRAKGEPVAYILGRKEFYGLELVVDPSVLVPRPETELLVDLALQRAFGRAADLGTGSGAVALALKSRRPHAAVVAVDSAPAALAVARRNAARLGLDVDLRQGLWTEPLGEEGFDLIVSNPPYVAHGDPHLAQLGFEPAGALLGGADGLDCIRDIARLAPARLLPDGWLLLEHGLGQDAPVRRLLETAGLEDVQSWPDLAGIPRVSGGKVKSRPWIPNSASSSK